MSMQCLSKQMLLWLMIVMLPATPLQSQIASAAQPTQPAAGFLPPAYDQRAEQKIAPAQLELLGYMPGRVWKVVANQTIAVALTQSDLVVLDIRQSDQPRMVSRLPLSTIYQGARFLMADLAMVENYVFISCSYCGDTGLIVVNVSVPTTPMIVGRMQTTGYVDVVKAYGELLYIALGGEQLAIVDIRTPTAPKLLGSQRVSGQLAYVRDIEIMETAGARYAFVVALDGKLKIFDVTNAMVPTEVASYGPERACMMDAAIVRSGSQVHLYVVDCYVGLRVLDVTVPTQPQAVQSHSFGQDQKAYAITAVDHLLFVTTDVESTSAWDSTLHVLSTKSATTLTEISTFHDFLYAHDLADSGNMLVLADEYGVQLLDFTDPAALQKAGRQVNVSAYRDLDSDGRYLYLVDPTGFKVVDTINPVRPVYVAEVPTPYAVNLEVDGAFALVTDYQGGLWIFDVQQPTQPTVVTHTSTPVSLSTDVVISGTLGLQATAFIGSIGCTPYGCDPSLIAVDLTNLQQPTTSVMLADGRGVADMAHVDNFLYLTTGSPSLLGPSALLVLDIANPQLPIEIHQTALPSVASSMATVGRALYIALADSLQTYDISNPAAPILKHTLALPRRFDSISVDQGFLYGKDGFNLTLVSLGDPFQPVVIEQQALPSTGGSGIVAANGLLAANGFVYVLNEGLTTWRHQTDLLGRVFDAWGEPQAGIRIDAIPQAATAANGATNKITPFTFSGLTGGYALPDSMTSAYTIQPTMAGHSVWPPMRQGVAPDTQDAQDFYLLAQPVSATVTSATAATLSYVDGRDLSTVVTIPAGTITQSMVVHLIPIMAFAQDDSQFTGNAFALQVGGSATQVEKLTFEQPVTVTIHYSDQGANAFLDESSYQLMQEVNDQWQPLPTTEQTQPIVRDLSGNMLSVSVRTTGRYALFGRTHNTYFPLVAAP